MAEKRIDRTAGNGSATKTEAFTDEHAIRPNDGRSKTETTFDPHDSGVTDILYSKEAQEQMDGKRRSYSSLKSHHEGVGDEDRAARTNEADHRRRTLTFADQLALTDHQTDRAMWVFDTIDMSETGSWSVDDVILGVISYVVDMDQPRDPSATIRHIRNEKQFRELRDDSDADHDAITAVRKQLHKEVDS